MDQGIAATLLLSAVGAAWKFCRWAGPRIEAFLTAHLELVGSLREALSEQTRLLRELIDEVRRGKEGL